MIISRTPFRISFFGGGTDYPDYCKHNPGASLATSIDKYCWITCRYLPPFFEHNSRIIYSKIEEVRNRKEITHPSVRESLEFLNIIKGIEIHHDGDLPARTGLGSSSAFTVGLLNALHHLIKCPVTKKQLVEEAIYVEQEKCKENVGYQDQIATGMGGFNKYYFGGSNHLKIEKINIGKERIQELESRFLLFFTGFSRTASEIAQHQIANIPNKIKELKKMYSFVDKAIDILYNREVSDFGKLLNETWLIKKELSEKVTNPYIDHVYDLSMKAGALGGKILGAGGGGFLLIFSEPEYHCDIRKALHHLLEVPFKFEETGTQIIGNYE